MIEPWIFGLCVAMVSNTTVYQWNARDRQVYEEAHPKCMVKYDLPCVVEFTKRGPEDWSIVCGK